jgi:hypothetical protein
VVFVHRADVADQQYGWQDDLFGDAQWRPASEAESMAAAPTMHPYTLWPGVSKPVGGDGDGDDDGGGEDGHRHAGVGEA